MEWDTNENILFQLIVDFILDIFTQIKFCMDRIVNDLRSPPKRDQNGIFHIDVMVSSINLMRFEATAKREGWELHNMVHDVQKLIEQSSHSMDLPRDELANEEGVTNLVPIQNPETIFP